ncbi:MAG TPA: hypothetical protein VFR89_06815 [candidate division Zixibacteria bacterium]|nr:hypothetical protein [candidate division Zixibacteria bacterium]
MREERPVPNADRLAEQGIILCNWNDIHEPGVYVDTEYPRYFRVSPDAIIPDGSPVIHGSEFIVARISPDVSLELSKIQDLCDDHNLPIPE